MSRCKPTGTGCVAARPAISALATLACTLVLASSVHATAPVRTSPDERIADTSDLIAFNGSFDLQTFSRMVRSLRLSNGSITGTDAGPTMTKTAGAPAALAASKTWNGGGGNNNWSTGANWGGTAPAAGDSLFFGGSTRLTNTNNLTADLSFAGITFNSGAGAFTLGGARITLGGDVTNSSTNLQTISLAMILSGNRTFTTSASGGDLTIGGVLSETGGARGIIKMGAGTLTLAGTNTYTGGTTINAGTVSVSADSNLGATSSAITFGGGTLDAAASFTSSHAINLASSGVFNVAFGRSLTDTGAISGNGDLNLTGYGTLILSGSGSNGTGATTLNGALSLRGTVSLGSGLLTMNTSVLELGNGDFTRALGTGAGQVNMSGSLGAGFAAWGADRIVKSRRERGRSHLGERKLSCFGRGVFYRQHDCGSHGGFSKWNQPERRH